MHNKVTLITYKSDDNLCPKRVFSAIKFIVKKFSNDRISKLINLRKRSIIPGISCGRKFAAQIRSNCCLSDEKSLKKICVKFGSEKTTNRVLILILYMYICEIFAFLPTISVAPHSCLLSVADPVAVFNKLDWSNLKY